MPNTQNASDQGKIFVGGLPTGTTETEFKNYFNQFGKVIDAVIKTNPKTGISRGFGFVTFVESGAVSNVLNYKHPHYLRGKEIDPKQAKKEDSLVSVDGRHGYVSNFINTGYVSRVGQTSIAQAAPIQLHAHAAENFANLTQQANRTQFAGCGPTEPQALTLLNAAANQHTMPQSTIVALNSYNVHAQAKAQASIDAAIKAVAAQTSQEMSNLQQQQAQTQVKQNQNQASLPSVTQLIPTAYVPVQTVVSSINPTQVYPDPLNNMSTVNKLYVGGLPKEASKEQVENYFGQYGEIIYCEIKKSQGSKYARRYGFVTYRESSAIAKCLSQPLHKILDTLIECQQAEPKTSDPSMNSVYNFGSAAALIGGGHVGPRLGATYPPNSLGTPPNVGANRQMSNSNQAIQQNPQNQQIQIKPHSSPTCQTRLTSPTSNERNNNDSGVGSNKASPGSCNGSSTVLSPMQTQVLSTGDQILVPWSVMGPHAFFGQQMLVKGGIPRIGGGVTYLDGYDIGGGFLDDH